MKLIKTILISVTAILLFLLIILFSIQTVDYAINGKTYSQVDKFFNNIITLTNNDKCQSNFGDVIKYNTLPDNPQPRMVKLPTPKKHDKLPLKPELYSQTIISCNKYKNDILALDIPKDIPSDKQVLLKKYAKLNAEITDSLLAKVNKYKNYNGYINKKDLNDTVPFQTFRKIADMKLTEIQARKRFSFGYFLTSVPKKHTIEHQLKMTDEIQKRESQKP